MLALCIFALLALKSEVYELIDKVDKIAESYNNDDKETAAKLAEELDSHWSEFTHSSILINDLGHAVEISASLSGIAAYAELEDDELISKCVTAKNLLELFYTTQVPTIFNIL